MIPNHKTGCPNIIIDWANSTWATIWSQFRVVDKISFCPFCKHDMNNVIGYFSCAIMCYTCNYEIRFGGHSHLPQWGINSIDYQRVRVMQDSKLTFWNSGTHKAFVVNAIPPNVSLREYLNIINLLKQLNKV